MRTPGFYPHEVDEPVQVIQTHISYIILTGPYAYKIKKPVCLSFLDFSTLESRRHFCNEELRLNQAFAPDLYIDVVPIYEQDGQYSLNPVGANSVISEYGVRMHQFDDSDLLITIFDRGDLNVSLAAQLGARIAEIHRAAPVTSCDGLYGSAGALAESVRLNIETILPFAGTIVPETLLDDLRAAMDSFVEKHERLFDLRIQERRVRECHGDLHLRNICIHDGHLELFDRIEFNELFKNIDVIYDLAFLLMDLRYRGRNDLANRVLNTYLEASGDYAGAQLLPFYQSVRALIRGGVTLMESTAAPMTPERRDRIVQDGVRYLEHAMEYFALPKGCLLATCGLSGSGKSTVALSLLDRCDVIHIRSDAIRKHLAGVDLADHSADIYGESLTRATYDTMIDLGIVLTSHSYTVILDAKFDRRAVRQSLIEQAESLGLPLRFIHCHAPLDVLKKRLAQRRGDISDATERLTEIQSQEFEYFEGAETALFISLDTEDTELVEAVLDELCVEVKRQADQRITD